MNVRLRDATVDDADAVGRILVGAVRDAFDGLVPERCLSWLPDGASGTLSEHAARSAVGWRRNLTDAAAGQIFLIAEDADGAAIGYVWAYPSDDPDFPAEVGGLHVLPSHQGRGVGRALLRAAARRLAGQEVHRLKVGVLRINPHRGFYEHLGGRFLYERDYDWDGTICTECFYGWDDTASLW